MPFLYKDLPFNVLDQSVEVSFSVLDSRSLKETSTQLVTSKSDQERLKQFEKVVLIGDPGIGKTTFQRKAILSLTDKSRNPDFINPKEHPIPIHVPLKLVDNHYRFPILTYITKKVPLFMGPDGLSQMIKMGNNRELFLFLDGYDEIAHEKKISVQSELRLILRCIQDEIEEIDSQLEKQVYSALKLCRVWLSTRKEFLQKNPLGDVGTTSHINSDTKGSARLMTIKLTGIRNREDLVKTVFNTFRRRDPGLYSDLLDEEFFLEDVSNSPVPEVEALSNNPLFLTVMCVIYAEKVGANQNYKVTWAESFEQIISEFIRLLLVKIDTQKVAGLKISEAKKTAIAERRGQFVAEKQSFLKYFSFQLFAEGKPVFSESDVRQHAIEYFKTESSSENNTQILNRLTDPNPEKRDLASQLFECGIFREEGILTHSKVYDFPHRRFREVLAAQFITSPQRYELLLQKCGDRRFNELLPVLGGLSGFRNIFFQSDSLNYLLSNPVQQQGEMKLRQVIWHFLKILPEGLNLSNNIENFLLTALTQNSPRFTLPWIALDQLKDVEKLISNAHSAFNDAVEKSEIHRLGIACAILQNFSTTTLVLLISSNAARSADSLKQLMWMYSALELSETEFVDRIVATEQDNIVCDFCYLVARRLSGIETSSHNIEQLRSGMSDSVKAVFDCFLTAYYNPVVKDPTTTADARERLEIISQIKNGSVCHYVTNSLIDILENYLDSLFPDVRVLLHQSEAEVGSENFDAEQSITFVQRDLIRLKAVLRQEFGNLRYALRSKAIFNSHVQRYLDRCRTLLGGSWWSFDAERGGLYLLEFETTDISDAEIVLLQLTDKNLEASKIFNEFSSLDRELLGSNTLLAQNLPSTLCTAFNRLLDGPSLLQRQQFKRSDFSGDTLALEQQTPQGWNLQKLNRWVIEDCVSGLKQRRTLQHGAIFERKLKAFLLENSVYINENTSHAFEICYGYEPSLHVDFFA